MEIGENGHAVKSSRLKRKEGNVLKIKLLWKSVSLLLKCMNISVMPVDSQFALP